MGQYYKIINIDRREYFSQSDFGNGIKLLEFGSDCKSSLTALTVLLADGNNRGGGDLHSDLPVIGSWAGCRIVVAGDYANEGKFLEDAKIKEYWEVEWGDRKVDNFARLADAKKWIEENT